MCPGAMDGRVVHTAVIHGRSRARGDRGWPKWPLGKRQPQGSPRAARAESSTTRRFRGSTRRPYRVLPDCQCRAERLLLSHDHGLPRRDSSGLWRTRIYVRAGARRRDASGPADVATAVLTCRKVAELPRKQAPRAASRTAGRRRRRCARGTEWGRSLGNTRRSPQPPRATTRSRRR